MFQELILHPFLYNLRKHISWDEIFVTFTLLMGIEVHSRLSSAAICEFRHKLCDKNVTKAYFKRQRRINLRLKARITIPHLFFSRW